MLYNPTFTHFRISVIIRVVSGANHMEFANFFNLYMRERAGDELARGGVEFRYAAAALLIALANADLDESDEEKTAIRTLLAETFKVSDRALQQIFDFAYSAGEDASGENTYLTEITNLINDGFPRADKIFIVRSLWDVARADGRIDNTEESFIFKAAAAIGLSAEDVEQARQLADQDS